MSRSHVRYLVVALGLILGVEAGSLSAQVAGGRLLDMTSGDPIPFARLLLLDRDSVPVVYTFTDKEGAFLLEPPESGPYWLRAEAAFYQSISDGPITVPASDTLWLAFGLRPEAIELEGITVELDRRSVRLQLEGVYERAEARIGLHFDVDDLRQYPGRPVVDLMRRVPGAQVRSGMGTQTVVFRRLQFERMAGPTVACHPQVFLNGALISPGGQIEAPLDRISLNDLEAVEVYDSWVGLPSRFSGMHDRCGTVALWSR